MDCKDPLQEGLGKPNIPNCNTASADGRTRRISSILVQKRLQKLFAKLPIYHTLTVSFCSPCTYGLHSAEVHLRDALPWSAVPAGGETPVQPGSKRALHLIPPEMAASSPPEHFHCPFVASDEPKHLPNSLPHLPKLGLCSPWLTPPLMPLL